MLTHLLVWLAHRLESLTRQLDLLTLHPASRMIVTADGISMMYLQKVPFAYGNIYVDACVITVDY